MCGNKKKEMSVPPPQLLPPVPIVVPDLLDESLFEYVYPGDGFASGVRTVPGDNGHRAVHPTYSEVYGEALETAPQLAHDIVIPGENPNDAALIRQRIGRLSRCFMFRRLKRDHVSVTSSELFAKTHTFDTLVVDVERLAVVCGGGYHANTEIVSATPSASAYTTRKSVADFFKQWVSSSVSYVRDTPYRAQTETLPPFVVETGSNNNGGVVENRISISSSTKSIRRSDDIIIFSPATPRNTNDFIFVSSAPRTFSAVPGSSAAPPPTAGVGFSVPPFFTDAALVSALADFTSFVSSFSEDFPQTANSVPIIFLGNFADALKHYSETVPRLLATSARAAPVSEVGKVINVDNLQHLYFHGIEPISRADMLTLPSTDPVQFLPGQHRANFALSFADILWRSEGFFETMRDGYTTSGGVVLAPFAVGAPGCSDDEGDVLSAPADPSQTPAFLRRVALSFKKIVDDTILFFPRSRKFSVNFGKLSENAKAIRFSRFLDTEGTHGDSNFPKERSLFHTAGAFSKMIPWATQSVDDIVCEDFIFQAYEDTITYDPLTVEGLFTTIPYTSTQGILTRAAPEGLPFEGATDSTDTVWQQLCIEKWSRGTAFLETYGYNRQQNGAERGRTGLFVSSGFPEGVTTMFDQVVFGKKNFVVANPTTEPKTVTFYLNEETFVDLSVPQISKTSPAVTSGVDGALQEVFSFVPHIVSSDVIQISNVPAFQQPADSLKERSFAKLLVLRQQITSD